VLFLLLLITWSPRLVPVYLSTDDLAFLNNEPDPGTMIGQGRPGQALLYAALRALGAHPVSSGTLLDWVAIALLAVTALALLRLWRIPPSPVAVLCVAIAFIHPNLAETFTFRFTPVFLAAAMVLAVGGLVLAREGRPVVGALLVAASFTIYQVTLNTVLTVVAIGVALDCARGSAAREALRSWARPALSVIAAALGYLVLQRLGSALMGPSAQGGRSAFLSPGALPDRLRQLGLVFERVLGGDRVLSTGALEGVQLLLLAAALTAAVVSAWRARRRPEAVLIILAVAVSLATVVGVLAVLSEFWPTPRVLIAAGPFWAGVLLLLATSSEGRWRPVAGVAGAVLLLAYAGIDHRVASDQVRLNVRELALASRIVGRLESLPGWQGVQRVAIVGRARAVPGIPQELDLNPSALSVSWSAAMLLREVTDRRVDQPSGPEQEQAERRCARVEAWPAAEAVSIDGPLAIACLR
jgi:hypothetical protein